MPSDNIYKKYYTYLIKFKPTGQLYYGVKYGKHSDPLLFWKKYKSSSREIKNLLIKFGEDAFEYEIRYTSSKKDIVIKLEHRVLSKFNARHNPKWLNKSNGYSKREFAYNYSICWHHCPTTYKSILCSKSDGELYGYIRGRHINILPTKESHSIFYIPQSGTIFSLGSSCITNSIKKFMVDEFGECGFMLLRNSKVGIKLKQIPIEFLLKINNGHKNKKWDSRIPLEDGWVVGVYRTIEWRESVSIRMTLSCTDVERKLTIYSWKHRLSGEVFIGTILKFHKKYGVSNNDISSILYKRQKSAKSWGVFLDDMGMYSFDVPSPPTPKPTVCSCIYCMRCLDIRNFQKWHGDNCKSKRLSP